MVAALDCLSPSLYDLLGNTVSSAVLLADVAVPGQVSIDVCPLLWATDTHSLCLLTHPPHSCRG
jgi:hypothetical protein